MRSRDAVRSPVYRAVLGHRCCGPCASSMRIELAREGSAQGMRVGVGLDHHVGRIHRPHAFRGAHRGFTWNIRWPTDAPHPCARHDSQGPCRSASRSISASGRASGCAARYALRRVVPPRQKSSTARPGRSCSQMNRRVVAGRPCRARVGTGRGLGFRVAGVPKGLQDGCRSHRRPPAHEDKDSRDVSRGTSDAPALRGRRAFHALRHGTAEMRWPAASAAPAAAPATSPNMSSLCRQHRSKPRPP